MIDLFSDTNCSVSKGMRQYIADAEVGNEVAGEDPTVNMLLEKVIEITGKESAVFLPSGSMCNTLAFRAYCKRVGDGIILEKTSHPVLRTPTIFSGVVQATPITISGHRGIFTPSQLENTINRNYGYNYPSPCLVSVENPTNYGGGAIWEMEQLKLISQIAKKYDLPTYMDGARLFVAQEKTGIPIKEYVKFFDSVYIDFCKTLAAPMGAVLAGTKDFIDNIWFHKFQFGGFMHKAGFLAAACLYGLEHNLKLIGKVLDYSQILKDRLTENKFIEIDFFETNILILRIEHNKLNAYELEKELAKNSIRIHAFSKTQVRLIVHFDISEIEIEQINSAFSRILQ